MMTTMTNLTAEQLHALGFTRQSKSMWRKGDVTYQNGKFYDKDKKVIEGDELCKIMNSIFEDL